MSVNARVLGKTNNMEPAVPTANPDKMLLMLYNGAIKNIENAEKAIIEKDFNRAHIQIIIAQDIISRQMLAANCKKSPDLIQVYDNLRSKLVDANIKKDAGMLEEIRSLMIELLNCKQQEVEHLESPLPIEKPTVINLTRTG